MFKISLRAARINAGLTQKEAAKALGVSNSTLHSWENGVTMPNAEQVKAICELYKVPYDFINFFAS